VYELSPLVLVLAAAAVFAYLIAPLVQLAERPIRVSGERRRLSRTAAIAVVYVLMGASLGGAAAMILPVASEQVSDMVASAPAYARSVVAWEHGWSRYYQHLRLPADAREALDHSLSAAGASAAEAARAALLALGSGLVYLPWLALVPILSFFLLKDAAGIRRAIVTHLPFDVRLRGHRLFEDVNAALAAYVRAQLLACLLVGGLCGVGFALIGVPYAVVLGVLAGVLEFIPLVGPLLLAVVAALVAALHAPVLALWAVLFLALLRLVQDYVIYPRLIRRGIELHPLAIILTVLGGAELHGVAGMFLAVPVLAIATVVYRHWVGWSIAPDAVPPSPPTPPVSVAP
jgi:predicted PurR-regulated permease PerM